MDHKRIKQIVAGISLSISLTTLATEIDKATLSFRDDQLFLDYSLFLGSGTVAVYHATDLHIPGDSWDLIALKPIAGLLEGSFQLHSYNRPDSSTHFFQIRTSAFQTPKKMVWIKPGTFIMGSPVDELGRFDDEGPQHPVNIKHGYWLSKYEVTQEEFMSLMGGNPSRTFGQPNLPVESVSWFEAVEYCERLNRAAEEAGTLPEGYEYRLPTTSEWEYACRAGTETAFSFGDDINELSQYGWWADNSAATPFAVGMLKPNPWGLYDMHGNVFEWCHTPYQAYPGGSIRDTETEYRTIRGGAFICPAHILRSACRFESAQPDSRSWLTGFRIALGPKLTDDSQQNDATLFQQPKRRPRRE